MLPLPDEMIPLAQEARQNEVVERSFGPRACHWWLVEIDKAVVFQPWVDLTYVRQFQTELPKPLGHEDHIRVASGSFTSKPKVIASQISDDRYAFISPSTDVRFLGASLIDPSCIQGQPPRGYPTHVLAVYLGSGVNCLSAVHVHNRVVL